MQSTATLAIVMIAVAGILGIASITTITAYGQISQQPPITSNDECLPGSLVHCIDSEENPPNLNDDCLPGSMIHCIDGDHNNRGQREVPIKSLLEIIVKDFGIWQ